MNKTVETKDYGTVEVRTAVFDLDGTTLQEGIEIKGDDIELTEIAGYYDVENITSNEVNDLLGGQVQDLIINLKTSKLTIEQFNEKYGFDAFQLALDNGFDKDELLNEIIHE